MSLVYLGNKPAFLFALFQFRLRKRHAFGRLRQRSAAELHHDLASTIVQQSAAAHNQQHITLGLVVPRTVTVAQSRGSYNSHQCSLAAEL